MHMANCIFCNKYVKSFYLSMDGNYHDNIIVKQSGKHGQIIAAHRSCYMNNLKVNNRKD